MEDTPPFFSSKESELQFYRQKKENYENEKKRYEDVINGLLNKIETMKKEQKDFDSLNKENKALKTKVNQLQMDLENAKQNWKDQVDEQLERNISLEKRNQELQDSVNNLTKDIEKANCLNNSLKVCLMIPQ